MQDGHDAWPGLARCYPYAIALSAAELAQLRDNISAILDATDDDIGDWLDDAAAAIAQFAGSAGIQRPNNHQPRKRKRQER